MHPNRMFVFAAVATGCLLIALPAASQAHQTQPVLVMNGPGASVPTAAQGTTNIAGTVSLSSGSTVSIGNTPNVNVANTPAVSLAPGAGVSVTNPLDGQSNPAPLAVLEAIQPYESSCEVRPPIDPNGVCGLQAIPSGKRLVVQELDAWFIVETGIKPTQTLLYTALPHFFPMTLVASGIDGGTDDSYAAQQATRLYFTGPGTITCAILPSQPSYSGSFTCGVSGFLVDVR